MAAHFCKVMQLAVNGRPVNRFRLVTLGFSGQEKPRGLCGHQDHETPGAAGKCAEALRRQRELPRSVGSGRSMSELFGDLFK